MATIITLAPGDKIQLQFAGVDGKFEVHYSTGDHANALVIKETHGLSGNVCGEANAVLYEENLGPAMASNAERIRHMSTVDYADFPAMRPIRPAPIGG